MYWTNSRRTMIACCAAAVLLAAPGPSRADCPLLDWLFGHGQTTYAPPYCPPNVGAPAAPACGCAPAAPACGCAPALPACQPIPAAAVRVSYRPATMGTWCPTVAYMPVVSVDPCSGCAVTTYRPTQAWTYQASLAPYPTYRVGYAPVAVGAGVPPARQLRRLPHAAAIRTPAADARHAPRLTAAAPRAAQIMAAAPRATPQSPAAMSRRADAPRADRAMRRCPALCCLVPPT